MPINPLPTPPSRADSVNFALRGDAFMAALPGFATEAEAARVEIVAKEASAAASAATATTKAGEASASAAAALASQNSASGSAATATTKAGEASTSATAASGSAATATTKANEAADSAASVVRDGSGGVAGLTLFKLNLRNAADTITSWLTNTATVARTWAMQDRDGTVALVDDITGGTMAGSFTTLSASGAITEAGKQTYNRGNVLGTVSQSAGVPTGALMEYGSNANGEYWRYAGGSVLMLTTPLVGYSAGVHNSFTLPSTLGIGEATAVASVVPGTAVDYGSAWIQSANEAKYAGAVGGASNTVRLLVTGRWF